MDAISEVSMLRLSCDAEAFLEVRLSREVGSLEMVVSRVVPLLKRFAYSDTISVGRTDTLHTSWEL